jgi:hypothetical protein
LKITAEAGTQHQDTYGKSFFCVIYMISFSRSYSIERHAAQVYISPSLFITVNENMKASE